MSNYYGTSGIDTYSGTSADDTILGYGGDDTLSGAGGNDDIAGGGGIDVVDGNAGIDTLRGEGGNDILDGGADDDLLIGGKGADTLDGGDGDDTYRVTIKDAGSVDTFSDSGTGGADEIDATRVTELALGTGFNAADSGIESILGHVESLLRIVSDGSAVNWDFTGVDLVNVRNITGSSDDDVITGSDGADSIRGDGGADELDGGAGNDKVNGGGGDDTLTGGAGDDSINGGNGIDTADYTGAVTSVILTLVAGAGSAGGHGSDTLTGIENVTGSVHADTITGDASDNVIIGGDGDDTIFGGLGSDHLLDGIGNDTVSGGNGADTIFASAGNDILAGEAGIDTLDFKYATTAITLTLSAGSASPVSDGNDTVTGFENITGSTFDDAINGDANGNVIKGRAGDDILDGSAGDDTLNGGPGNDDLTGGGGDDTFAFDSALGGSNLDVIAVIQGAGAVGGDVISLDDAVFTSLAGGFTANMFVSAANGPVAADGNDFILYDRTTGALYYDADADGAGDAVQFATLSDSPNALAFTDFAVI